MSELLSLMLLFSPALKPTDHTIQGTVIRGYQNELFLQLSPTKSLPLKSPYLDIQSDLDLLENGDYIIGTGEIRDLQGLAVINDLEIVGIKRLLGAYKDINQKVRLNIRDFFNLSIYPKDGSEEHLSYRLTPLKKNTWHIFVSRGMDVELGEISYLKNQLTIDYVDVDTGEVSKSYHLYPQSFLQ